MPADRFLPPDAAARPGSRPASDEALPTGSLIGAYRIEALIGDGGQARVYRARDSRIGKSVAIKVLPAGWIDEPDRRARFEREARVLAALSHPNIATIHGLAEGEGRIGLVLELVEGATLAERIARGPLPVSEATPIARQIALALEAAHDQGVIHRDVKPANIKVTSDGTVKVLDFGLAKLSREDLAPPDALTASLAGTREGLVVGTVAYMSPEQARGQPVDKRTDVWAFGCVLFEMLTGRRAFFGETTSDTLAAVLDREPEWTALPAALPEPLRKVLRRCLEKDPARRLRDIGDARLELDDSGSFAAAGHPGGAGPQQRPSGPGPRVWSAIGAAIGAATATAVLISWPDRAAPGTVQPAVHLPVDLGRDVALSPGIGNEVALSPNGERLVFASNGKLVMRRLDQSAPVVLDGTDGVVTFFFSPDGESVAFATNEHLKRIELDGGRITTIAEGVGLRGGTWSEDGTIVATGSGLGAGLSRLRSDGGTLEPLTSLEPGEFTHRWPEFLPGGQAVIFTTHTLPFNFDLARVEVVSLADRRRKVLQTGATFGRWVPGPAGAGFLTFVRAGTLFAVPFDPVRLETSGEPIAVLEQVATSPAGAAQVHASTAGTLVYRSERQRRLHWLPKDAPSVPLVSDPGFYGEVAASPDGQRVAFTLRGDILVQQVGQRVPVRLTRGSAAASLLWTPDGRFIVLATASGLMWMRSDGGSDPQPLFPGRVVVASIPASFNPDGSRLAFMEIGSDRTRFWDLWTATVRVVDGALEASEPALFLGTNFDERQPSVSPDGHWIAYSSDESGTTEVWVRPFPDDGRKWKVSDGGGEHPRWSPAGRTLFYRRGNQLWFVPYTITGTTFSTGSADAWSAESLIGLGNLHYTLTPDGRIAAVVPDPASEDQSRRSVTFWIDAPAGWKPQPRAR